MEMLAWREMLQVRQSLSEGMLCLEGRHVKLLGKSPIAGLQMGKKLDLFLPPESSFFWLVSALLILSVQRNCDLLCFVSPGQGKGSASTSAARG